IEALPYPESDALVEIAERGGGGNPQNFSWPDWIDVHADARTLERAALFKDDTMVLGGGDEPRQIAIGMVTADFFAVLGAPVRGRGFQAADDVPGAARTVVVSRALWREAFGADPGLVGRSITLDTEPYTVIGIADYLRFFFKYMLRTQP